MLFTASQAVGWDFNTSLRSDSYATLFNAARKGAVLMQVVSLTIYGIPSDSVCMFIAHFVGGVIANAMPTNVNTAIKMRNFMLVIGLV